MKIAQVLLDYNKIHGHGKNASRIADLLSNDHEMHIFANTFSDDVKSNKVIFHYVPTVPHINLIRIPIFFLIASLKIKLSDFDIVHAHEVALLRQDVITAHFCHEAYRKKMKEDVYRHETFYKKIYYRLFNFIISLMEKIIFSDKYSKHVIAVSGKTKKEISNFYSKALDSISVIYNGLDSEKFNSVNRVHYKQLIRNKLNIAKDDFVLFFVGDFERKGLQYLLHALSVLRHENYTLLVAGEMKNKYFLELSKQFGIINKIKWLGKIKNIEVFYKASDLFIFPTLYDPWALVVQEAIACDVPVIVSDSKYCGISEILEDKKSALLLKDPTDYKEIADKIDFILDNCELRKHIAKNAKRIILNYTSKDIVQKTLSVYNEVLKIKKNKK